MLLIAMKGTDLSFGLNVGIITGIKKKLEAGRKIVTEIRYISTHKYTHTHTHTYAHHPHGHTPT
jgi:hypothetical protein